MGHQIYEIMLFFSIYSILGWLAEICAFALREDGGCRGGVCSGPWCTSFGLGALAVLGGAEYFGVDPIKALLLGMVFGFITEIFTAAMINGLAGQKMVKIKWYHPILFGLGGALLVCHLHPLLTAFTHRINPWIHFGFLILFWIFYPGQLIEGLAALSEKKRKMNN